MIWIRHILSESLREVPSFGRYWPVETELHMQKLVDEKASHRERDVAGGICKSSWGFLGSSQNHREKIS